MTEHWQALFLGATMSGEPWWLLLQEVEGWAVCDPGAFAAVTRPRAKPERCHSFLPWNTQLLGLLRRKPDTKDALLPFLHSSYGS